MTAQSPTTAANSACEQLNLECIINSVVNSALSSRIATPSPTSTAESLILPSNPSAEPDSTSSVPDQATPKSSSTPAQSSQASAIGPIGASSSDSATDSDVVHGSSTAANATHGGITSTDPVTTLVSSATEWSSSTSFSSVQPTSGSSQSVNAPHAKSFRNNKAAVAGVFGAVGLIFILAIVFLAVCIKRRRRARNLWHLRSRHDTTVTPFIHVSEERRRGMLRSVFARILNKNLKSPGTIYPREADDGVSVAQSEPPPYSALEGLESPALPAFSNGDEPERFLLDDKDMGVVRLASY